MSKKHSFNYATTTASDVANDWLLPDGVHDVLFTDADKQQLLRHHLINQLCKRGYQLVTPPLIEFTESLLGNASEDLKRQTFKIIDQLSGRLMGLRADTTPQILRIDANYGGDGIARYCYAGHTIHTLPTGLFGLRTPLQLGAEIFGTDDLSADFEMLDVLYELLTGLNLNTKLHLDIGHVAIFRRLSEMAALSHETIEQLMLLYANKALPELEYVCKDIAMGNDFYQLANSGNDLQKFAQVLSVQAQNDQQILQVIDELTRLQAYLQNKGVKGVSIDVSELSGYHYHSGLIFNVFMNSGSQPIVRGGRFDGSTNGRTRPAIGFSMDVTRLLPIFEMAVTPLVLVDFADLSNANAAAKMALDAKVAELRAQDYRVVVPLNTADKPNGVTHLLKLDDEWVCYQCG
ncbi:MAG: ATP phosphoribosyltransferase regulatory subunit [Gammaproteobacteria bacterium]|nr:MAG: ATP phosphoribosyltransferase regulatory subunit [Gammaproteobacteria bacterium]